jgi:hypothetical protein
VDLSKLVDFGFSIIVNPAGLQALRSLYPGGDTNISSQLF